MVAGLTMAVVPRSLGLVAALAVSGTTLYFVYGYNKKKAFVNIQRGKGSWRLEYLHGGSDIPQQQQQQQPVLKQESGVCVDLNEGEDTEIEEVQWHESRWLRKAIWRLPQQQQQQPFLLLPANGPEAQLISNGSGNGSLDIEQTLKDRLVNCGVDAGQVSGFRDTENLGQHQRRSEHVTNFSIVVTSTGGVSQSELQGRRENSDNNSAVLSSSSFDCRLQERPVTDSCSEDDFSPKASLSSAASSSSSEKLHCLVGCRVSPGSGKTAGKPKKVVRFSSSVAEPSSNNQAYRSRFNKVETAQRAALQVEQQKTHVRTPNAAGRSIAYDRPRQTLAYSVHRYRGRSYY